jgi:very-short-patch-repair endonuclease
MDSQHLFNRKRLKPFRSFLRNNSTSAEAVLWGKLKSKYLDGRKFRRQHSIGKYIVDFYCPLERLIIELDGDPHGDPVKVFNDSVRDKYLEELGFTVLRFENRLVFQEPEFVLNEIKKFFKQDRVIT